MRLHIFFCGRRPGILDIDKKIPMLTKIYPDCEIESDEDLKGDFKKEVIIFYEKFVESEEKNIERLEAKI